MTRAAGASIRGAIRTIVSLRTATSPRYHGLPGAVDDAAVADDEIEGRRLRDGVAMQSARAAAASTDARMARMAAEYSRRAVVGGRPACRRWADDTGGAPTPCNRIAFFAGS